MLKSKMLSEWLPMRESSWLLSSCVANSHIIVREKHSSSSSPE